MWTIKMSTFQNFHLTCQNVDLTCPNVDLTCQNVDFTCQNVNNLKKSYTQVPNVDIVIIIVKQLILMLGKFLAWPPENVQN